MDGTENFQPLFLFFPLRGKAKKFIEQHLWMS
jgi:hypothetical protein